MSTSFPLVSIACHSVPFKHQVRALLAWYCLSILSWSHPAGKNCKFGNVIWLFNANHNHMHHNLNSISRKSGTRTTSASFLVANSFSMHLLLEEATHLNGRTCNCHIRLPPAYHHIEGSFATHFQLCIGNILYYNSTNSTQAIAACGKMSTYARMTAVAWMQWKCNVQKNCVPFSGTRINLAVSLRLLLIRLGICSQLLNWLHIPLLWIRLLFRGGCSLLVCSPKLVSSGTVKGQGHPRHILLLHVLHHLLFGAGAIWGEGKAS